MTFALASQFHVNARLAYCLNSVLNMKAVVAAFNQEKALEGAFSVIVNFREPSFEDLVCKYLPGIRGHISHVTRS